MSVESRSTTANDDLPDDHGRICTAPSCWENGEPIEIDGRGDDAPILCEFHAKSYLGVST